MAPESGVFYGYLAGQSRRFDPFSGRKLSAQPYESIVTWHTNGRSSGKNRPAVTRGQNWNMAGCNPRLGFSGKEKWNDIFNVKPPTSIT